jgi:hypothetical protein
LSSGDPISSVGVAYFGGSARSAAPSVTQPAQLFASTAA